MGAFPWPEDTNFLLEGGYEDWSVIDYFRGVKPAAMAMSTLKTMTDGRTFAGMLTLSNPHVFAARFTARVSGQPGLTIVWTDNSAQRITLSADHQSYDETGAPTYLQDAYIANGAPRYLEVQPGTASL